METPILPQTDGDQYGFGIYPVRVIPHHRLVLSDGVGIAMRIWFPHSKLPENTFREVPSSLFYKPELQVLKKIEKYPVILESIPYRKSDYTVPRDHQKYTWFCSHGYVCVRVDTRGTGDSEGFCLDEYSSEELRDTSEIIEWLSSQSWSNGSVGIYGESWGAFLGLQTASIRPPALKTIIAAYASDYRYELDCHYMGGCVLASEMLPWSSRMLVWNATPPHPGHVADWRTMWLNRLEKVTTTWASIWLSHQLKDEYWKRGSISENCNSVTCPVLMIGGLCDPYLEAVLRITKHVPNAKCIVGPWNHDWPAVAIPGPQMDILSECLKWFDHHLKHVDNDAMEAAPYRLYLREATRPNVDIQHLPGKWVNLLNLPDEKLGNSTMILLPKKGGLLSTQSDDTDGEVMDNVDVTFAAEHGSRAGGWIHIGFKDHPADQRVEDGLTSNWTTRPLNQKICLLGSSVLHCTLSTDPPTGILTARLCHVWPEGKSTLITYGALNLCHSEGHASDQIKAITPGEILKVKLQLHSTIYTIPEGHRIRLALCTNYWPRIWPAVHSCPVKVYIETDSENKPTTCIMLRLLTTASRNHGLENMHRAAKTGHKLSVECDPEPVIRRSTNFNHLTGEHKLELTLGAGKFTIPGCTSTETSTYVDERLNITFTIREDEPLSAKVKCHNEVYLDYMTPFILKTRIVTNSEMWSDVTYFYLSNKLVAYLGTEVVFSKSWTDKITRNLV